MLRPVSLFVGLRYTLARRRNRSVSFISAIAMLGIVLGVALLITVLSVMNGFDRELRERILNIMPQITLYHRDGLDDWQALREQILDQTQVQGATPFVELQVMLHRGKHTQPTLLYGVDDNYQTTVSNIELYLRDNTARQLNKLSTTIALGSGLANKLSLQEGDKLTVIVPQSQSHQRTSAAVRRVQVIDVFTTGTELDHSLALMGLSAAADLGRLEGVSGLHLKVDDLFRAPTTAAELRSQLPYGYYTSDWTRTHGNLYYAIKMSKNLVALLLLLIIAIAAFNVVSTLVMVVVDKQKDIAVLQTMGLRSREVMLIFIIQGMIIGVVGSLIGAILGVAFSLSVGALVAAIEQGVGVTFLHSDIYPVSFLPSLILVNDILVVIAISIVMSLLATLYPAWKATRVSPAKALRYD